MVSAYYYLRVVKTMYLSPPPAEERLSSGAPIRLAILSTFAGLLFFGLYPLPLLEIARAAAGALFS